MLAAHVAARIATNDYVPEQMLAQSSMSADMPQMLDCEMPHCDPQPRTPQFMSKRTCLSDFIPILSSETDPGFDEDAFSQFLLSEITQSSSDLLGSLTQHLQSQQPRTVFMQQVAANMRSSRCNVGGIDAGLSSSSPSVADDSSDATSESAASFPRSNSWSASASDAHSQASSQTGLRLVVNEGNPVSVLETICISVLLPSSFLVTNLELHNAHRLPADDAFSLRIRIPLSSAHASSAVVSQPFQVSNYLLFEFTAAYMYNSLHCCLQCLKPFSVQTEQGMVLVQRTCHCDDTATLKLNAKLGSHDINPLSLQISAATNELSLSAIIPSGVFQFKRAPGAVRSGAPCSVLMRCTHIAEQRQMFGYSGKHLECLSAATPFQLLGKMAKLRRARTVTQANDCPLD